MRRIGKNRKENSFLFGFLVSYIAVLLVPIFLCLFIYMQTVDIMKKNAQQSNMAMLEQIKYILDERFMEIDNAITQLSDNPAVQRLQYVNNPLGGTDAFKVRFAIENLKQYMLRSSCIEEIYIYFSNSDIMISSGAAFIRLPLYYNESFKYGDLDYTAWHSKILQGFFRKDVFPATPTMQRNGKENSMILYMQSIPLDNYKPPTSGNIIVMIKESEINKLLSRLNIANGGWAYVADKNGNIVSYIANDKAELMPIKRLSASKDGIMQYMSGNVEMTVTSTKSVYNNFTYVAAFPKTVIMANTRTVSTMIMVLMVFAIVSAFVLAYFMAYRNSSQYRNIFVKLRSFFNDSDVGAGGFEYINGGLSRLLANNIDLTHSIERQLPLVQHAFYNKLLHGEFKSIEELNLAMEQVCLHIHSRYHSVAIVRVDGYKGMVNKDALKELSVAMEIIKTVLTNIEYTQNLLYNLHSLDSESIALIISSESEITVSEYEETTDNMLHVLYDQLHHLHRLNVTITVGNTYENLNDLYSSYYEALQAGESMANLKYGHIIWYRNIPKDSLSYYYPIDIETRLINLLKSGNNEGVQKLIDEIYRENTIERTLTPEMSRQIIFELKGTLIKIIDQISEHGSQTSHDLLSNMNELTVHTSVEDLFECFKSLAEDVCSFVNMGKTSRKSDLMQKVLQYVDSSYHDCNLCLTSVAEQFNFSEAYLCQLFKDHTGDHFSSHLTNIRLKHACNLLLNTDISVNDIAAQTGFNSAHSFRRSFKRVIGVNPLEYRDQNRGVTQHVS